MTKRGRTIRVLLGLGLLAAVVGVLYWGVRRQVCNVDLIVNIPPEVRVGEPFKISVVVKNPSASKTVDMTGIDVGGYLLVDSRILSVTASDPPWRSTDYRSGANLYVYDDIEIPPLAEKRVTLTLTAGKPGTHSGWIAVMTKSGVLPFKTPAAEGRIETIAVAGPEH